MIVWVADSGATKTEWRMILGGKLAASENTHGFNPNAMGREVLEGLVGELGIKYSLWSQANEIHFYGSGLRFEKDQKMVASILNASAPSALIEVKDDLTGAVRSTLRQEGIVAILGTGSNACLHRDFELKQTLGGHGFLLGDEGFRYGLRKTFAKSIITE